MTDFHPNDQRLVARRWIALLVLGAWLLIPRTSAAADLDPANPKERVLLLLSQGPLLVELSLTIDEQPFRMGSEKLLDSLLEEIDADHDGQLTWTEVTKSRSALGRSLNQALANPPMEVIEKAQARRVFAGLSGNAFSIQGQAFLGGPDGSQIQQLLDSNGDGGLSDEEIAAAPEKLRSRDADDNEIITPQEIVGFGDASQPANAQAMAAVETILGIDDDTSIELLHATLIARYGRQRQLPTKAFRLTPKWIRTVDADSDEALSIEELAALKTIAAPLALDVALGTRTRLRETVQVTAMTDELKRVARIDYGADGKLILDLLSIQIEVLAPNPKPKPRTFAGQAKSYIANLDRDQNGYLEKSEVEGPLAMQFDTWDSNGDGMVFEKELNTALARADAPNWHKISVAALTQGNNLMKQLDANGDERLGVRETRSAAERLHVATFDEREVLRLAIARGNETYRYLRKGVVFKPRRVNAMNAAASAASAPEWFLHMDTNADGDITLREFLGTQEQFERLDANADNILEAGEVQAKPDEVSAN